MHRRSSLIARSGSCIGSVPRPVPRGVPQAPPCVRRRSPGPGDASLACHARTDEALRVLADDLRNVVVQVAREVERVLGLGPVREHDRDGGEDLHSNLGVVAVAHAVLGRPRRALHRAERLAVDEHGPDALQVRAAVALVARALRSRGKQQARRVRGCEPTNGRIKRARVNIKVARRGRPKHGPQPRTLPLPRAAHSQSNKTPLSLCLVL